MTSGGTVSMRHQGQTGAATRLRSLRRLDGPLLRGLLGAIVVLALLELLIRAGAIGGDTLPAPSEVISRMVDLAGNSEFRSAVGATLWAWALGLTIAIAISVPLGLLLGLSALASRASSPVIEFMRPIPAVALIPLVILVWGQGLTMKLVLIAYATTWPILFNTIAGVHDVDKCAIDAARCYGLRRMAVVRRVVLPSAAPFVLTGIRISASIGLIVLIGAELIAGSATGIGAYIFQMSANVSETDGVLAAAAFAGLLGLAINVVLGLVDRRLFAWHHERSGR